MKKRIFSIQVNKKKIERIIGSTRKRKNITPVKNNEERKRDLRKVEEEQSCKYNIIIQDMEILGKIKMEHTIAYLIKEKY